ncbi:MAG: PepSY domain-containing protein [Gemmatimonadaceae bacterium]
MKLSYIAAALVASAIALPPARAQATYKRDLPDSLVKASKITEEVAAATAQKRLPKAKIEAVELERENGKLQYSYDMKTEGKSGIDEVNVNAVTGKIIAVAHETPATEKKEAAAEAKAAAKTKKP